MPHDWYTKAPGDWLIQLEKDQLNKWLPLIQSASVLQIGGLPHIFQELSQGNNHEYYFLANQMAEGVDIVSAYDELPLRPGSINLVLIIHVLEFMEHPTILLKEVFDTLAPNGKMLLFCFNPWSLWGMRKLLNCKTYPWQGKFRSPARLQQWLRVIGYSKIKDKTLGFRAPFITKPLTSTSMFMETLGQITIPMLGAVNVFLVEKRVYGAIQDGRYAWQKRQITNNGMVEPTTRVVNE